MKHVYLIYSKNYSIESRSGFSSTVDLNKGQKIHDQLIQEGVMNRNLPFVVTLGGGYGPETCEIHCQFIAEILKQN